MVVRTLKQLKRAKAPGEDEVDNETWRLMPYEIGEAFMKLINKV